MVQSEPTRPALVAALACSGAVSAQFVAGKAARDALFLANAEVTALPAIVALTALVSIGLVGVSSFSLRRVGPSRLVPWAFWVSTALFVAEALLATRYPLGVARALYIHVSGLGPLLGSGFWLLAVEHFHPRAARKHFGQLASVGTLSGLAGALVAERIGAVYGVAAMLPVHAALNAACALLVARFPLDDANTRPTPEALETAPELAAESPESGLRALARTPYLQNLALLVLLGTVAATLADYVFKAYAAETFGRGDALLRFFAIYYAAVSLLAFVVQT